MKVLLVNTYHYRRAGAEVHALDLAERLQRRGHEVRFFAMQHSENLDSPDSKFWVPEIDYRTMHSHRNPLNATRVLSRAIYSPAARKALARMLDDWAPDVAHLHNLHAHLTPSVVDELKSRNVPTVWTLHDYKLLCPNTTFVSHGAVCERCKPRRFWQCTVHTCKKESLAASLVATIEAEAHRALRLPTRVDAFVAPSAFLRQKFVEFGWPGDKIAHIPNFNSQPLTGDVRMPSEQRVLYSGQLVATKGIMTLLEGVRDIGGVRLDIAGEGPLRGEIEAWVAAQGSQGADVRLHGRVDSAVLEQLIDAARLVVVPSEWYENSPYAVIEAFARARPVIASRIGGLPELVVDGVNGATVTPGSPTEIEDAIRRLLDDPDKWLRLAHGALAAAQARSIEQYAVDIETLYSGLIDSMRRVQTRVDR